MYCCTGIWIISSDHLHEEKVAVIAAGFSADTALSAGSMEDLAGDISEASDAYVEEMNRWKGPVLSKSKGTVQGPSGKETYYNLNMAGVVKIMRRLGYTGEYWVRDDGCKMLGDYIMVAANLNIRPRGTILDTSLGEAMVCDTGTFAKRNPTQIDIAVTW